MRRVGWPIAVADGVDEVKAVAKLITTRPGGRGAVREAVEWLLDRAGLREEAVRRFLAQEDGFSVGKPEQGGPPRPGSRS